MMTIRIISFLLLLLPLLSHQEVDCPDSLVTSPYPSQVPAGLAGKKMSGIRLSQGNSTNFKACVSGCCGDRTCSAALLLSSGPGLECYQVYCDRDDLCLPVKDDTVTGDWDLFAGKVTSLVLVRPHTPPWPSDIQPFQQQLKAERRESGDSGNSNRSITKMTSSSYGAAAGASTPVVVCEIGLDQAACQPGEICLLPSGSSSKSRNGVCSPCPPGSVPAPQGGVCQPSSTAGTTLPPPLPHTTLPVPISISVVVTNKTIRLPTSAASLTAFTIPQPTKDAPYEYLWKMLPLELGGGEQQLQQQQQPQQQGGTEANSNSETLKLEGLTEGVYLFKVTVTSSDPPGYGETTANVTVLPALRINKPPTAIIVPVNQTVTLPTSRAVLDGSKSSDDSNRPLTYEWRVKKGPMGYEPKLQGVPTLSLDSLKEGHYLVELIVRDEDGLTDTAEASLTVLKETDYPPKANAGEDEIVYLPTNTVTLNGNKSSDDHGIVSWEWTKKKEEGVADLPADISGARSPYLTVANLEQGIYNFVLKVTDSEGQSRQDEVAVYVKPPSNLPPTANAGEDQVLNLPLAFIRLDGSQSTDDINITEYTWQMVEGPKVPVIAPSLLPWTNVTNFTVGEYIFRLTVKDGNNNNASDTVRVTVKQDTNQPPVAVIRQLENVVLPVNSVVLDGSDSSDDLAVDRWEWSRDARSASAGTVIGSWSQPKLVLTGILPGSYKFHLQVWDEQGKTGTTVTSWTVLEDPNLHSAVDLVLDRELDRLPHSELKNVLDTIKIFVRGEEAEISLQLDSLQPAHRTGFARLRFKIKTNNKEGFMPGVGVVSKLRSALDTNPGILGIPVLELETVVCTNSCGGHGACDENTRECVCQPFWTENPIKRYIQKGEPNCDWSVIYVCVVVGACVLSCVCVSCCCSRCRGGVAGRGARNGGGARNKRATKYSRLHTTDMEMQEGGRLGGSTATSDSEEEILFESSKKGRRLNGGSVRVATSSSREDLFTPGSHSRLNT